jgi:hypothetical protein
MIRAGSSCRDSLREVVRNTYAEFSGSLNDLIAAAADALRAQGHARQVLFVIDGPDRFRPEDWRRFFVDDVNQLTQLAAVVVYAAPLALKVSGHRLDLFEHVTLPMVKLLESDGTTPLLTELVGLGALLEYNAGSWRQTHPVVRTLAGYEAATRASRINPLVAEAL